MRLRELKTLVSVEDELQRVLQAINAHSHLNAFVHVNAEDALEDARRADMSPKAGWLAGAPIAIKQNLWVNGWPCTAGAHILEGFRATEDATAVRRLRDAGAVIVGLTNMDALGMGGSTELGTSGPATNPNADDRVTGGSSGGSAAAVAAGLVPVALGSDTGGSIRQPAAYCGVVGLRPTWSRVSRRGLVAFASSLDTVGPLAATVADAAAVLTCIAGHDQGDATSSRRPVDDLVKAATQSSVVGKTVGRIKPHVDLDDDTVGAVDRATARLQQAGVSVVDVELAHAPFALSAYVILASAEASSNLARLDGVRYGRRASAAANLDELVQRSRSEGLGPEVIRRVLIGTYVLAEGHAEKFHAQAAKVRTLIIRDYERAFAKCDLLLGPTTPGPAFARRSRLDDPLAMYRADEFTVAPSLAGLPGISVPDLAAQDGLPRGVQLVAPWWHEAPLIAGAVRIESAPLRNP